MIPAAWVVLDRLPLTPGGKLDRKALPAPSGTRAEGDAPFAAPQSPIESEIAAIWRELLHVDHVSRNDSFFDLGGHSLLAMQAVAHINEAFQLTLRVQSLFDAPRLGEWAARVESARQTNAPVMPPPVPRPRPARLPLSSAQQRMWVLNQLEPDSPWYHIAGQVRVKGSLDRDALESSLNEMIDRHEALRTSIHTIDGQSVQVIAPNMRTAINVSDLSGFSADEAEHEWWQRARTASASPFDLSAGPLLRAYLYGLSAEEHVLQIVLHHLIADGWSLSVWMRELACLYEAHISGKAHSLRPLPLQYADYALWQRDWLQSPERNRSVAYWKARLADLPILELPTDRSRPANPSYHGGEARLSIPQSAAKAVRELSRQEGVTLFMILLAAWQALLSRYSGQKDIAVGTVVANRSHSELESLIGLFVNTLVLRTDLSDDPLVEDLLARVRALTLEAYDHQDLPFEKVVDELQPARSLSQNPLFQVMFVFQNTPVAKLELGGLHLEPIHLDQGVAKFDLTLEIEERDGCLDLRLEYASDLFDRTTAERMLGHYEVLLQALTGGAGRRLSELPVLTAADRRQVLDEWNRTETTSDSQQTVIGFFEDRVVRDPLATAVVCGGQELSYLELNARANQLAHYLRTLAIGPESLVGLCLERSAGMLVGLLGVLKAGGAYVPLDPAYPPERLAYILSDAGIQVLLTEKKLTNVLPAHGARVVCLDTEWPAIALQSSTNPGQVVMPHNAGYVIYTSGSTGRPKGVVVTHGGMVNLAHAQRQIFGLGQDDAVLQFASPSFDAAVWEWLMALTAGAQLVISSSTDRLVGPVLEEIISTRSVTVATLPPSALSTLSGEPLPGLRTLVVAGEACPVDLVRQWAPGRRMLNAYGPTESTVCATVSSPLNEAGDRPIGRPMANTEMYVLDGRMEPVPIGVMGELYIGGSGLARGYLNRPDLTAERFVPHPHSANRGERLYRTGDLGRWRADGVLEFLGRADHQVKIRGHRIEPGEVETALRQIPEIATAAVMGREDQTGQPRLVAYIVPRNGHAPGVTELRSQLATVLPDYMIPSSFVPLEALPVTPNGKLDRKSLPVPEGRPIPDGIHVAPRTPTEELLAKIWRDLLQVDRVGVHDNFFELGGDSILAIQAVSKANQAGLRLTPKQLFQQQTVEKLAAVANSASNSCAEQELVVGEVPLTPIQRWFFEQEFTPPHHWNQSVLLEVRRQIAPHVFAGAVQALLHHHDALRTQFHFSNGEWQQQIAGIGMVTPFEYVDCRDLADGEFLAALDTIGSRIQSGFDLSRGPLIQVAYLDRGPECSGRLLVIAHHLVIDGVSWRILVEDLETACRQMDERGEVELPPKTTSFQQWSRGLQAFARSWLVRTDSEYWLDESRRYIHALPLDAVRGRDDAGSGELISTSLTAEETHALLHETAKAYHTQVSDLLLTALSLAHAKWTGNRSLAVDLEGHGREAVLPDEEADLSRTVGWFTSLFPMLLHLPDQVGLGKALNSVKEQLRRAPKRGVGYGLLRYLSSDHELMDRLRALPSAEISFNYLGQVDAGSLSSSGLFGLASENCGSQRNVFCHRTHLLDVTAQIAAGTLEVTFHYSRNRHRGDTIEQFAHSFMDSLRTLIAHCRAPESGNYMPPRTTLERQIVAIWEDVLNRRPIGIVDHFFFDLGGNSLLALAASAQLQELTGSEISAAAIFQEPTIERMARVIQSNRAPRVRLPLVPIQPKGSKRPFFCVHPAPGSVFCYFDLAQYLGEDQPFYGLQAQGLESGEVPLDRIEEMAALYIDAIRRIDPDGPYLIGGHSFGALVAYEMMHQLQRENSSVSRLVILDCMPPVFAKLPEIEDGPASYTELIEAAAAMIERFTSSDLLLSRERLERLTPDAQVSHFLDRLREIRFIPGGAGGAYVHGLLRVLRANGVALSRYAPCTKRAAPITLIRAAHPKPEDYPSQSSQYLDDLAYGWGRICPNDVEAFTTPGDHITMLTRPHVGFLAQQLRSCFAKAESGSHPHQDLTTKVQYAG
jgi:amino acid adenylation domain-containing protein/non-ribosomal peptide synthase protein (TIGR01720 family)